MKTGNQTDVSPYENGLEDPARADAPLSAGMLASPGPAGSRATGSSFALLTLFSQGFPALKRDASRDRASNDIAHFSRWSDQQAELAEDEMSFF
jgi:hypothetical protein